MPVLFDIKNIACRYKGTQQDALRIEKITIDHGDIVFFLGASGVGKSTILETLGLMSNTISHNTSGKLKFCPNTKADKIQDGFIDYLKLWQKSEDERSRIRQEHFSFIFQSDNLFDNLSIIDNVSIPMFLQGASESQSRKRSTQIFERLFSESNLDWDSSVKAISGGQKQRVSFARAIAPNFKVIYADEPTGNLDSNNADNLMEILVDEINGKKASAIIVSHDIDLAIKYANKIVFIDRVKEGANSYGHIHVNSVFKLREKNQWINENHSISENDLVEILTNKLKN